MGRDVGLSGSSAVPIEAPGFFGLRGGSNVVFQANTPGTTNFTVPGSLRGKTIVSFTVLLVAGGGGGAGGGIAFNSSTTGNPGNGGSGGGSISIKYLIATLGGAGAIIPITIRARGAPGAGGFSNVALNTAGHVGSNGTDSLMGAAGSFLDAGAGSGGSINAGGVPG